MSGTDAVLELEHVTRRYDSPSEAAVVEVLDDICLSVGAGESIAVTGPSGSGKSTLLNIMGALDRPSSGTIRLAGKDLSSLSDTELSRVRSEQVGFVFQMHHLLPQCTVLENVLVATVPLGGAGDAPERAKKLLGRVGLGERLSHPPGRLSGGECQRVAVVRALINRPALLLADEPTGSLDRVSAGALMDVLEELHRECGTTLVVVTHADEIAGRMTKRYSLADGRLSERSG